ncbi:MAG: OsmC family peroxiredoxin [Pyrinomonadaceae bacterium]
MAERKAIAEWTGTLTDGEGRMVLGSGTYDGRFSFATRMGDEPGSNPEEFIGAALAGCYSMALNASLEKRGTPAENVRTEAKVFLGKDDAGFKINRIDLSVQVRVDGVSEDEFLQVAETVKKSCPISRALAATDITLDARFGGAGLTGA